jgi:hypothetical protein
MCGRNREFIIAYSAIVLFISKRIVEETLQW